METNTCSNQQGGGPVTEAPRRRVVTGNSNGVEDADLTALLDAVVTAERSLARAVVLAGRLASSGVCERVEGLPLELWLGLAARMTGADRRMLVSAGEVLADLPTVARLFAQGSVSWGQVRAIVSAARRLRREEREILDARVAASVEEYGGVGAFDPDQLLWAVDAAVDELKEERSRERRERRRVERNFLALQQSLEGGVEGYFRYDPVTGAAIVNALDAAAGLPRPEDDPESESRSEASGADASAGDADDPAVTADGDAAETADPGWSSTARSRQLAPALAKICAEWLGGDSGRPARPLVTVHLNLADAAAGSDGTVELNVRGGLPRLTTAAAEALARDADIRAVLFDGMRPLAVSRKLHAEDIPSDVRLAVRARDRGCRFPGSADPIGHSDIHHTVHREHGGDHHPDGLVALSRRHHRIVHRHGWTLRVIADTGEVTARRGGRCWRSLPKGTPLARAPDRSPPDRSP